jgi:C-terminal processing protease CtpA/Prc
MLNLHSTLLLACFLATSATPHVLSAQSSPVNLDFEEGAPGELPSWRLRLPPGYAATRDSVHVQHGRWSLRIGSEGEPDAQTFGNVLQRINAIAYRGKRIRLSGHVRANLPEVYTSAVQLWLRVDRTNDVVGFFDNMATRPITGRSEWREYEIEANIDADAEWISFGMFLRGEGRAWFDNFSFTVLRESAGEQNRGPSPEAVRYLTSALDSMQRLSVRRDSVDWDKLREQTLQWAGAARTTAETYVAIQRALRELGDQHSFFMTPQQVTAWQQRGNAEIPAPVVRRLEGGLGYILLPAYGGGDRAEIDRYAAQLHQATARVDAPPVCGWVVDLRQNEGGNMWPMLAGIGPVLGEGVAGMFVDPEGRRVPWSYAAGTARHGSTAQAEAGPSTYVPWVSDRAVAVLTGAKTGSSGEAIAVSFRARPDTRSFGQRTYGLSTANRVVQLSDGARIMLTTSTFADRSGTLYGGALEPDVLVEADASRGAAGEDLVLSAAKAWLREQPACSGQE